MLGTVPAVQAQIQFHDVSPDTTVTGWDAWQLKLPGSALSSDLTIWRHPSSPDVVVQTHGDYQVLFDAAGTYPAKLSLNDSISGTGIWKAGNYDPLSELGKGNWVTNAEDKYLGFRRKQGTDWQYAWLEMSVAPGAASFTVKEWAYQTTLNKSVKAGQISNTPTGVEEATSWRPVMSQQGRALHFDGLSAGPWQISVLDGSGRRLLSTSLLPSQQFSLEDMPAGNYFIQLTGQGKGTAFQIVL